MKNFIMKPSLAVGNGVAANLPAERGKIMRNKIIKILEDHQQMLGEDVGVGASMYGVVADQIIKTIQQQVKVEPEVIKKNADKIDRQEVLIAHQKRIKEIISGLKTQLDENLREEYFNADKMKRYIATEQELLKEQNNFTTTLINMLTSHDII